MLHKLTFFATSLIAAFRDSSSAFNTTTSSIRLYCSILPATTDETETRVLYQLTKEGSL